MGYRQKGIVKRADLEGQIEDIEVMPITWDECVLIGRTKPLSEVFTPKGGGVKENQVLAVAAVDDNGNPVAWKYTDGGGSSSGGKDYRIAETPSGDYAKSYKLQFKGEDDEEWTDASESFVINVPKDMVVESGSVKTCTEADTPVSGYEVGDKYIDLVIANSDDEHIYILVSDLVNNAADGISYDNTESELKSTNVQEAIDEVNEDVTTLQTEMPNKADKSDLVGVNILPYPYISKSSETDSVDYIVADGKLSFKTKGTTAYPKFILFWDFAKTDTLKLGKKKYIFHAKGINIPDNTFYFDIDLIKADNTKETFKSYFTDGYAELIIDNTNANYLYVSYAALRSSYIETMLTADIYVQLEEGDTPHSYRPYTINKQLEDLRENKADKTEISSVENRLNTRIDVTLGDMVKAPQTAEVGQVLSVKAVDDEGKPVEWECVEKGGGSGGFNGEFALVNSISQTPYEVTGGSVAFDGAYVYMMGGAYYTTGFYKLGIKGWESLSEIPLDFNEGRAVVYNKEIHILGGNPNYRMHYKWNGNQWISATGLPYDLYNGCAVVHNGEIHILGGGANDKNHYKWNGTTWTSVSNSLVGISNACSAVSFNDEIHLFGSNSNYKSHCKWDGTTWTALPNLPLNILYKSSAFIIDNEIHLFSRGDHYKYDGTTWKALASMSYSNHDLAINYKNNNFFVFNASSSKSLWFGKYDKENGIDALGTLNIIV